MPADTRGTLARLVAAWMKTHGHPLKVVAGCLGVAESTICQWAHGKRFPTPESLDDLARCAGVPTFCLLCPHLVRAYEAAASARKNPASSQMGRQTPPPSAEARACSVGRIHES